MPLPAAQPKTIKEAVNLIVQNLDAEEKKNICESDPGFFHHSAGMSMRNNWSLWERDTPIKLDAVKTYGIAHADDLSGLIMEWVWATVRGEVFNPQVHCQRYHEHWKQAGTNSLAAGGY